MKWWEFNRRNCPRTTSMSETTNVFIELIFMRNTVCENCGIFYRRDSTKIYNFRDSIHPQEFNISIRRGIEVVLKGERIK